METPKEAMAFFIHNIKFDALLSWLIMQGFF
jgi:hypothetical protein